MNHLPALQAPAVLTEGDRIAEAQYTIESRLGRGNSGEVYSVSSPRHLDARVVKLFVPFYEAKQRALGVDPNAFSEFIMDHLPPGSLQGTEYKLLSRIDHPFVVKVHDYGRHPLNSHQKTNLKQALGGTADPASRERDLRLPFIISAHIYGEELATAIKDLNRYGTLRVLSSLAETVSYLHRKHQILHLDIKSSNVLVREDGYPILLDFALARDLAPGNDDEIVRGGIDSSLTPAKRHLELSHFVDRVLKEGVTKNEFRENLFPSLDLFQLGVLIDGSIDIISSHLTPAEGHYLQSLVDELVDWDRVRTMSSADMENAIRRIDSTRFFLAIRPGSTSAGREMILSQNRRVFVPSRLIAIADHPELTRLHRLNQLGLLSSEFPGATHSRYEHSLDVLRLAESAARRLLDDSQFRRLFDEDDVTLLLAAGLLHDINHVPFTHILQETEVSVIRQGDLFRTAFDQPHEPGPLASAIDSAFSTPQSKRLHRILAREWSLQDSGPDQVISSLLDSGIDLDKLSYLQLDSERSGLSFSSGIDISAVLSSMTVVKYDGDTESRAGFHIAFPESALPSVEEVVRSRVRAFRELYWCNINRAMMAQFLACIRQIDIKDDSIDRILGTLVHDERGKTDYMVLRKLDDLAKSLDVVPFDLAAMFDSLSAFRPILIYESGRSEVYSRLRELSSQERVDFEDRLYECLLGHLPNLVREPRLLMVDVPRRALDLGGEILIVQSTSGGAVTRTGVEASPLLKELLGILQDFSSRVRIFASADAVEDAGMSLAELRTQVSNCVMDALGARTMR